MVCFAHHQKYTIKNKPPKTNHQKQTTKNTPSKTNHQKQTIKNKPSKTNHQKQTIKKHTRENILEKTSFFTQPLCEIVTPISRSGGARTNHSIIISNQIHHMFSPSNHSIK